MDGTLSVEPFGGFRPQAGESFTVMTYGSEQGDFASFKGLDLGDGLELVPNRGSTAYTLTVQPVPEPLGLALTGAAAAGGGLLAWRRRRARS